VLVLVAIGVPLGLSLRDRVAAEVHAQARSQADVVAATASGLLRPAAAARLDALLAASASTVRGRVIVVDARGRVLADSAAVSAGESYRGRPEIAAALRGRSVQETRRSTTLGADILATAVPIRRGPGPPAGAVRITQSVSAVHRAVRRAVGALAGIGLLVLVLGLAAGTLIAAQIARPIHRLDHAARRVERGDLDARVPVEGSSEQQRLARAFNAMTGRIARLLRGQQEFVADASHHLRTPLSGVRLRLEEARALTSHQAAVAELDAGMREVDRLADIVDELLVLSRSGERELPGEWVDSRAAAAAAVERWASTARARRQRLVWEGGSDGVGRVWCAPADLDRILDVLVANALRYSPSGSTVRLVAARSAIDVLDAGPGLAAGEEDAVFERFHRGSAGRAGPPGSGLGLPIARELAAEWAAAVELVDRPEGGARASVRFRGTTARPATAGAAGPAAARAGSGAATVHRGTPGRAPAAVAVLATAGIALAAGVSLATGALTSQRIGLAAEPISAGAGLAPAKEEAAHPSPPAHPSPHRTHRRPRRPATTPAPPAPPPPARTVTAPPPVTVPPPQVAPAPAPATGGDEGAGADD
jgi:signal transduction histidine kinase